MKYDSQINPLSQLISKFENRTAVIGIVGLGYVGLPLMLRFVDVGFKVLGIDIDIDAEKVDKLNLGKSYIEHISPQSIEKALTKGFQSTIDFSRTTESDTLIICVPTQFNAYREPDLSFVPNITDALVPYMRVGQIMSLKSTTYPGTTDEELKPHIESRGLRVVMSLPMGQDLQGVHLEQVIETKVGYTVAPCWERS